MEIDEGPKHDQHKINLFRTLDDDSLLSIARFLSGCDAYRLALSAKRPFFSTSFSREKHVEKLVVHHQPSHHSNSLALLKFNDAKLPGKTRVRVVDKGQGMCLGITAQPFEDAPGEETSVGTIVSSSYQAVGVSDLTLPREHAVVRLDSGSCVMVPYDDMQLLNCELYEYLKRSIERMDLDAMRVLGYCLMNGEGGLQQSCEEGGYWLMQAARLGDKWSNQWLFAIFAKKEIKARKRNRNGEAMSPPAGPTEPSEAFRTLAEAEAWAGWVVSAASSPFSSSDCSQAEENSNDDDHLSASSWNRKENAATTEMASALLHRAMRHSLHDILLAKNLTFEDIFPPDLDSIDIEGRPQVLIAGSAIVQAVLGKRWSSSDIDVFCTWEAAPLVRERLIASGQICNYCGSEYGCSAPLPDAGMFIHHVEGYCTADEETYGFTMEQALKFGEEHLRDAGSSFDHISIQKIYGQVMSQKASGHVLACEACIHACSAYTSVLALSASDGTANQKSLPWRPRNLDSLRESDRLARHRDISLSPTERTSPSLRTTPSLRDRKSWRLASNLLTHAI